MTSLTKIAEYYKYKDLTGDQLEKALGKKVVLFSDLAKYKNISQLLGPENYVVILYQTSSYTNGHYVAITRSDKGVIRFNDSYGIDPLRETQYTAYDKALPNYIADLLQGTNYEKNTIDFQSWKRTATCGRWSLLFCKLRNFSIIEISHLFQNQGVLQDKDFTASLLTLITFDNILGYFEGK